MQLFAIDELDGYSTPLTVDFLKANDKLLIDTAMFGEEFREKVIAEMHELDGQTNGLFFNSENADALRILRRKFEGAVKCIYIDPPYNTGGDGFAYKDSYQHSSWLSMIEERLRISKALLPEDGVLFSSIDHIERNQLENALDFVFDRSNRVEEIIWVQNTTKNRSPTYSTNHEYIEVYAKNLAGAKSATAMFRERKPGYVELMELVTELNPAYLDIPTIREKLRQLFNEQKQKIKALEEEGVDVIDEWKGIYNYNNAEYRDASGRLVEDPSEARRLGAKIWVWREVDVSMPQIKEDSAETGAS